jgi:hypothetical protein
MGEQMVRPIGTLSAVALKKTKPGLYADGGGLYLQVTGSGGKSWIFRYMINGRRRDMGLGPLGAFSLADARAIAGDCRKLKHQGIDPISQRAAVRLAAAAEAAKAVTFRECCERYITAHQAAWRNAKHAAQWETTLATYAEPVLGTHAVQAIDTTLVMKVLEQSVPGAADEKPTPLWSARPETARRLRGRIEAVLDWAAARGYRQGENPARWRGHLDHLLPARSKVRKLEHHAALPYPEIGEFMTKLRAEEGKAARAFEFAILTGARTGETIGAIWSEIDMAAKVWTVAAARMKAAKESIACR